MKKLLQVSLRQQAIYIPKSKMHGDDFPVKGTTATLIVNLSTTEFLIDTWSKRYEI